VFGADHHTLARVDAAGRTWQFAFTPEMREGRLRIDGAGAGTGAGSFVWLGVEHMLTGYDHLLFLFGLMLPVGGALALAKIITAFTVAHSVTLAVAVFGLVTIPDRIVEPVIAASIVWVALENLLLRSAPSQRWLVSFLFGLVHGFGFASAIDTLALPRARLTLALLGFNLGVEAGQGIVVVFLLPLLLGMRRSMWEPWMMRVASLAVALVGTAWLVQRLFFGWS